ncbi:MAG: hypothetical protein JW789_01345 [Candidatus Aenigmarchaeota archaeon]|nr:hypothetical protein [Candidatus Aenigmarchaeota archaeon]
MMTKKTPIDGNDKSIQNEQTIILTKEEFLALSKLEGKRLEKVRYFHNHNGTSIEIDVFSGDLAGLVLVDVEFNSENEKSAFRKPDFCLADVTQEDFLAGGMLAGNKYEDIAPKLAEFGYKKPL